LNERRRRERTARVTCAITARPSACLLRSIKVLLRPAWALSLETVNMTCHANLLVAWGLQCLSLLQFCRGVGAAAAGAKKAD
jgi:hypothetical protein